MSPNVVEEIASSEILGCRHINGIKVKQEIFQASETV
jgi:hypothetical protein